MINHPPKIPFFHLIHKLQNKKWQYIPNSHRNNVLSRKNTLQSRIAYTHKESRITYGDNIAMNFTIPYTRFTPFFRVPSRYGKGLWNDVISAFLSVMASKAYLGVFGWSVCHRSLLLYDFPSKYFPCFPYSWSILYKYCKKRINDDFFTTKRCPIHCSFS